MSVRAAEGRDGDWQAGRRKGASVLCPNLLFPTAHTGRMENHPQWDARAGAEAEFMVNP